MAERAVEVLRIQMIKSCILVFYCDETIHPLFFLFSFSIFQLFLRHHFHLSSLTGLEPAVKVIDQQGA